MADVKDGEVYVAGPTRRNAQLLLAAAKAQGLDPSVVRSTAGGFIVPAQLVEDHRPPKKPRRKPTSKSAQGKERN